MNVGLPGNIAIPIGFRNTRPAIGEIVDLERFRKLRRRREAEAKKVKRGNARDGGKAEDPSTASVVERAGHGGTGSKGAAKTRGDDSKTD